MSVRDFHAAERHSIVTPLGVQFLDDFSGAPVARGLDVWTWPEATPRVRVPVRLAGSAVYAAHGLPGLREFEAGSGDDEFWRRWLAPAQRKRRFVVEARDREGRYLPVQARIELPAFGIVRPACSSLLPPSRRHAVPLFSASTRSVPATAAIVRAELYDRSARRPAAWAVVDASFNGRVIARGMADRNGGLVLLFAYPEPQALWTSPPAAATSPATSPPMLPLSQQSWWIDLTVRYARAESIPDVPDLCDALAQPPAQLLDDAASPSHDLTRVRLRYGEAAVLRTTNTAEHERGVLVITSGSPL